MDSGGVLQGSSRTPHVTNIWIKAFLQGNRNHSFPFTGHCSYCPIKMRNTDTPSYVFKLHAHITSSVIAEIIFTCASVRYSVLLFILRCKCMFWMGNEWILLGQLGHSENPRWGWCHRVSCWRSGTRQTAVEKLFQNAPKWKTRHVNSQILALY